MTSTAHIIRKRRNRRSHRHTSQTRSRAGALVAGALVLVLVVVPLAVSLGGAALVYGQAVRDLPAPQDSLARGPVSGATELYDRSGSTLLLAARSPQQTTWVTLESLPPYVAQATLTAEDPDFLTAPGFSLVQTFGRLWQNLILGPLPMDTSLTGRLVRNVIAPLPEHPTADDIGREIALVAEIQRRYTPPQILEWHLNTNYYGSDAYGIEAAARAYLGKRAADLTLDEAALLAAIPLAPQYNPFDNEPAARGRQLDLLRALRSAALITGDQFEQAAATLTPVQPGTDASRIAPEYAVYARRQAETILDGLGRDGARLVAQGGLKITTALDLDLYYQAECSLRAHLARLNGNTATVTALDGQPCNGAAYLSRVPPAGEAPPDSGVIVVIDPTTGELKAMVGAGTANAYPPGPTLFPFVYFEGFLSGLYTPATMLLDIPRTFPGAAEGLIYTPQNPDGRFRGPVNLRDAMSAGLLPPAVQVARSRGLDTILSRAHRIGLNSLGDAGRFDLSLLERGGQVSVLDMAYAYSVFSALGDMYGVPVEAIGRGYRQRNPAAVLKIEDGDGNVLWEYTPEQVQLNKVGVFPAGLAYLINDILADSATRQRTLGEGNTVDLNRPAAIVNGLAGDGAAGWTVGYTPQLVAGVVVSRGDGAAMSLDKLDADGAAPVWRAVMQYVLERDGLPPADWTRPADVVEQAVCVRSGLLPNNACPTRNEIFLAQFVPAQTDTYWQTVQLNSQTGQRATASTPAELRTDTLYFIPPPEAADWWQANNMPLPPEEYDTVSRPELFSSVQILQPQPFAYVRGVVDIRGTLDPTNMQYYQLAYGEGPNPSQWIQIGEQQTTFQRGASLGTWDTSGLPSGLYNILLTVVRADNTRETAPVQVTVDNTPPTISLSAGEPGKVYRWPQDTQVTLAAEVQDDYSVSRVEFYHNGQQLGADESWPYGFTWDITRTGTETFSAVAIDAVGNSASADLTVEITRGAGS
ncbi:MAG: transglycosylase domain-containing protein [Chloroflexi bacterium]|nr:transglycosylase domain-containing protein [Chloroflexota bacterium]